MNRTKRILGSKESMLDLLEHALPIIEREAAQRDNAKHVFADGEEPYWQEMRDLANAVEAEILAAKERNNDNSVTTSREQWTN